MTNAHYLRVLGLWLSLILLSLSLLAQVEAEDLPPVSRSYVLTNVTIHPQPGQVIEGGIVLIENGLITALGTTVQIPGEALRVEADSMHVYAGFIDGLSQAGMEDKKDGEGRERREDPGNPPPDQAGIQPQRMALDLMDASSSDIEKLRQAGFTVSHVVPKGGMLPGQGALILLGGPQGDAMRLAQPASLFVQYKGASRMYPSNLLGVMATFKQLYGQAKLAMAHEVNYTADPAGMPRPAYDRTVQAMYPMVEGKLPAMFLTPKRKDVFRAMALQQELGFSLALAGVMEGGHVVDALARQKIPVFLSLELPDKPEEMEADTTLSAREQAERKALVERREEAYAQLMGQAQALHAAGVVFGFASYEVSSKDLPDNLRRLVKETDLTEETALAALTTHPAQLLGLSDRLGTVEVGKIANLVVSDQPYFSEKAKVRMVFVDGQFYELEKKKKTAPAEVNVLGSWAYTVETPQGSSGGTIVFSGDKNAPEGIVSSDQSDRDAELEDLVIDGKTLTATYTVSGRGSSLDIELSIEIDGDTFEGNITLGPYGSYPIEGERTEKPD
jgi:imidazolonepropionase-like amidohydrolase